MAYKKMNPEVKQLWLDALRSGKYVKGIGQLKGMPKEYEPDPTKADNGTPHCCLGVLVDLSPKEDINLHCPWRAFPSPGTRAWAGLSCDIGEGVAELASINDHADTFGPAIVFIEENL